MRTQDNTAKYDYLIVGAGLFGAVVAHVLSESGKKCLVVDRREHIAGNCYTEKVAGIDVHKYGAHIFHTFNEQVWTFVNQFAKFNRFTNSPIANYKGEIYNLPFNMNTFNRLWSVRTPEEAEAVITKQKAQIKGEPQNLEEQAISLVGSDIYEKLIKGYTEKQWGRSCKDLPAFIIRRLPVRFTYDNNYFNDPYQGIPVNGYTELVENLLKTSEVRLNIDYLADKANLQNQAKYVIYTGALDEYFAYCFGKLAYRSLKFETELLDKANYQGNAVVNYTEREIPYTRIIEHKHFNFGTQPQTVITREYPCEWQAGMEPYYPVNDDENQAIYAKYAELADKETNFYYGGRLAEYKYYNMDQIVLSALNLSHHILSENAVQ